jgi:hypothetical protein
MLDPFGMNGVYAGGDNETPLEGGLSAAPPAALPVMGPLTQEEATGCYNDSGGSGGDSSGGGGGGVGGGVLGGKSPRSNVGRRNNNNKHVRSKNELEQGPRPTAMEIVWLPMGKLKNKLKDTLKKGKGAKDGQHRLSANKGSESVGKCPSPTSPNKRRRSPSKSVVLPSADLQPLPPFAESAAAGTESASTSSSSLSSSSSPSAATKMETKKTKKKTKKKKEKALKRVQWWKSPSLVCRLMGQTLDLVRRRGRITTTATYHTADLHSQ